MKNGKTSSKDNLTFTVCVCLMILASVMLPILLKTNSASQYRSIYSQYVVGAISDNDVYVKNSVELIDTEETQKLIEDSRNAVLPIYTLDNEQIAHDVLLIDRIREAVSENDYGKLVEVGGQERADMIVGNANFSNLAIAYDIVRDLYEGGYFVESEIEASKEEGYGTITLSNHYVSSDDGRYEHVLAIAGENLVTDSNISTFISSRLKALEKNLSSSDVLFIQDFVTSIVSPNVRYDGILTVQRRNEAEENTDPVVVKLAKGQLLIAKDHVVTHKQVETLRLLSTQGRRVSAIELIDYILFDSAIVLLGVYVFKMFLGKDNLHKNQSIVLLTFSYVVSVIAAYYLQLLSATLSLQFTDSFLPVFFLPLFISMITGFKRLGFVSVFMFGSVLATLPTSGVMTFFYCIICGSACVLLIRLFNRRIDIVYQWFFSCVVCSVITIVFMLINQIPFSTIFIVILGTSMNVSVAYLLIAVLIPIAERIFNLPTSYRLNELAFGESAVLRRLSQTAPGTYSHSRAVADLAEAGAKAIGANALLARVGGLYHDIGKIEHPEYFVENQSGVNKHDEISPSLSVAVIKSHVKVGAEKGKAAGLPQEIIKIIASHHGNDVIQYFYHEALKSQAASLDNRGEVVKAADYSYNSDIPDFRECAIVMLADSIEAASRTITPNVSKYEKLIKSIFLGKIERDQLNNSGLTLNDLDILADTFVKTLVAKNHSRIEYPEDDK